jgi:hypothetical protein
MGQSMTPLSEPERAPGTGTFTGRGEPHDSPAYGGRIVVLALYDSFAKGAMCAFESAA